MKLISSSTTLISKWVFPAVWFAALAFATIGMVLDGAALRSPAILLGPLFMAVIGYIVIRLFAWDLADSVYDFGDHLVVSRGSTRERIALENIMNVSCSVFVNPTRVTLRLVKPCAFGAAVSFSPKASFSLNPLAKNPIAEELLERAYAARVKRAV
jgi:hypothetical protein